MKHIFTFLLLWIGFAYVQAAPIYEMTPPDPVPMRSMQVMTSDIRYTGVTYAPFTAALPSEQSAASESSSGRPTGSVRRGFGKPDEIGQSEEYPIGEPWILAIFAILFAGFITWKNKTTKELHLQYQKNNSTMKNKPSIQSVQNKLKVSTKSVVNATKVQFRILIFAFLTLGVGNVWGYTATFYCVPKAIWGNDWNDSKTVKIGFRVGDGDNQWWDNMTMSNTGKKYNGNYICSLTNSDLPYDGVKYVHFYRFNGGSQEADKAAYDAWANCDYWNNHMLESSWMDLTYDDRVSGGNVYFDVKTSGWEVSDVQFVIGHGVYSTFYNTAPVSHTQLYYISADDWSDAWYFAFANLCSEWSNDSKSYDARKEFITGKYTEKKTDYNLNSGNYYVFNASSSSDNAAVNSNSPAGHKGTTASSLNSTQTIKYAVSENGGTPALLTSGTVPATISMSSYKFVDGTNNSVSTSTASNTLTAGGSNNSATIQAAYTGTTVLTMSSLNSDYAFLGWFDAVSGGNQLESGNTYTYYPRTATTVYARFSHELNHTVTIRRYCTSTSIQINSATAKIGEVTYSEITAPEIEGYSFTGWVLGNGVSLKSGDNTSSATIHVKTLSSGTHEMTANYTEVLTTTWKIIGAIGSGSPFSNGSYASSTDAMLKKSGHSAESVAYKTFDVTTLPSGSNYYAFKVAESSSVSYGYGTNGDDHILFDRTKTNQSIYTNSNTDHDLRFKPDALGEYEFKIDFTSGKQLSVTFPTSFTVNFSRGTVNGTAGSVTAEYSSVAFGTGTKVQSGKSVTFKAPDAKTGYTWQGWYTVNNGSGSTNRVSEDQNYTTGISAATTLYACYTQDDYTISLDGNGGTGNTANVTAHYGENAPVSDGAGGYKFSITNPGKSGHTFAGWYTNSDGTGTMLIDVEGHLTPSIDGYTDGTGKWIATAGTNLYARWKANASVGTYNFQYGSGTFYSSTWSLLNFGAAENHKRTVDWTLIDPTDKKFYVGYDGDFWTAGINGAAYGSSEEKNLSDLRLAPSTLTVGTATGAVGKLVIFDDSNAKNLYAGFQPNGYGLTYAGGSKAFSEVGDNMWQTEIVTITAEDVAGTFKVGLETASPGTYVDCSTMTATDNAAALNTRKDALVSEQSYPAIPDLAAGQEGRFVIWDNDTHAGEQWYLSFLPVYTITYNANGAETGSVPTDANKYRTNETPTVLGNIGTLAKTGYAFSGWNTQADGSGIAYAAGANLAKIGSNVVLYAQFEKAQITALTLSSGVVESGATVTATPVIDPSPEDDTKLCWKILRSNGNLLTDEGFTPLSGNAVSFNAPTAGGTYKVACVLRTGLSCSGGTVLDSVVTDLVVASAHIVTIRYQDSEGRSLAAPVEMAGLPLEWSEAINPPVITGYNFTRWEAGDGIFISTNGSTKIEEGTTTTPTIYMEAQYDGTLTAVYSKKRMIYFNNTLGWSAVYVYFYKNNSYWDNSGNDWGTGANTGYKYTDTPYSEGKHGEMIQIPGTNIYYFDAESAGVNASYKDIVFTEADQHNYGYFSATKVVRRGDYKSSLPMFVPLAGQTPATHNTSAKYYDEGYWMNYPENTGYTLHIYSGTTAGVLDELRSIDFPFTADKTMPMEVTLELNANTTYGYEIHRADNTYYANSGTIKINASSDIKLSADQRGGVKTSAAGDYVFKLNFGNSSGYGYLFSVQYPASAGSYRLVYKDLAEWSQGSSHTDSWSHPSRVIYKNEGAADTVSFFVAKGHTPQIQIQKITSIDNEGNITWENVGSATSYDTVSAAGVYNFITSQTADAISIDKVEPYTGDYYIRTDAVDGKWDNYRTGADHLMTYSAFSEDRAQNTFGELFSHYKAKWCPRGTNVKFCIANDYSSCISDTLTQDVGNPYNNINEGGWLKTEDGKTELADKYSANIRFMWNRSTNKISRAYVSSSTNTAKKFLILKGQDTFWNSDGSNLSGSGESHANKEAIFQDNENWIYEREIKVTTGTKFKLFACYAQDSPSEANAQYFRGNYAEGAWTEGNYVILINGNGSGTCNARLIYDFKTNRLIAAYLPDGSAVSGETAIHADLMVIREHQGAGQQITFNTGGSLTEVKTVYGVMRFNRWILNNRQHPEDHLKEHCETDEAIRTHHPLVDAGSMKSSDERGLYWISFPFDVNLSEVFGFGTYGVHWIIMRYNGAARAAQGYWADSEGFWEYIEDRNGVVLKGGMGYVLALDLDLMQATDRTFWSHDIQQIELFFPSTSTAGTIKQTTATIEVPAHTCTIDRTNSGGTSTDINKNRTKVDSHWNIIGVPSFANYGTTLTGEGGTVTWNDNTSLNWTNDLPFLYEWNANDNTYTVQSGSSYPFKAMHAYYVQYHGTLTWSLASATTPSPIVARRTYTEEPQSEEFRLELRRNDKMEDQTFVKMSNDENASANFVFGEDLTKEKNTKKANIYTLVEGYIPVAGNTLPMSNQTTIVPVGVSIKSTGDYTFSIPEGTDGVGVVLVDEATGIRTSLSALDYTVTLQQGDYTNRFYLEISPIAQTPTGVETVTGEGLPVTGVRKVMIDGVLYIVRDGKIFDARGARVQ